MLFLSFVSILVYSILLGSFATESGIFNPCNNTTTYDIHEDKELMCLNYNGEFKALSISCIVIIVLCFLAIWDSFETGQTCHSQATTKTSCTYETTEQGETGGQTKSGQKSK